MKNIKLVKLSMRELVCLILFAFICFLFTGCHDNNYKTHEYYSVTYQVLNGGKIVGKNLQIVKYGCSTENVTAIPDKGYYFQGWSDGLIAETRNDINIIESKVVIAKFAEITDEIMITYKSRCAGGFIFDESEALPLSKSCQIVQRGYSGWKVEAKVAKGDLGGLVFIRWSDGVKSATRQDKNIMDSFEVEAIFGYPVIYRVNGNGEIKGEQNQTIEVGTCANTVTAVPEKGYRFVEWSDGVKTATRTDNYISQSIDVTAKFEWRNVDSFKYNYNYATDNFYDDYLTLTRGEVKNKSAVVPNREYFTFGGWYLDDSFNVQAVNEVGQIVIGEKIFDSPSRDLYAKWNVNDEYVKTYKILMVYVTAVDANLLGNDGNIINIKYKMSEKERKFCIDLTEKFSDTLNQMLDGLINFEIDKYFTEKSLNEQFIINEPNGTYITAKRIPELSESNILDNYRGVLTLFSFGGEKNLLPHWAGIGDIKYAAIPLDESIGEENIDYGLEQYNGILGNCVHEFIHTIEQSITCYEFHSAYNAFLPSYIIDKLYLLNQFPADCSNLDDMDNFNEIWKKSVKVGIPYSYWTNEIYEVITRPKCVNGCANESESTDTNETGGYVYNMITDNWRDHYKVGYPNNYQRVPRGSRTTILMVEPKNGYEFVGWSDGSLERTRIIYNVQNDIELFAYFKRLS